jgi:protocatechuate 3,4-dioxygenase beta subunit
MKEKRSGCAIGATACIERPRDAGAALIVAESGAPALAQNTFQCLAASSMTEGPYWVEEKLNRSDIRPDISTGAISTGVPLNLTVTVYAVSGATCNRLPGAFVDVWQCDATGIYSDVAQNNTVGRKFLRGYQVTDGRGIARFTTFTRVGTAAVLSISTSGSALTPAHSC